MSNMDNNEAIRAIQPGLAMAYLYNIALVGLAGFLCWTFKNGWGVLVLLFCSSPKISIDDDKECTC